MKAPNPSKKKAKDSNDKSTVGSVVADEEVEVAKAKIVTSSGVEVVDELAELDPVEDSNKQVQATAAAVASIAEDENLEIVFLEQLFDYPVIGGFNFRDKFGISTIRKHQKFVVPKHVAMVLLDRRLVTIPSMASL